MTRHKKRQRYDSRRNQDERPVERGPDGQRRAGAFHARPAPLPRADLVTANLTGALLIRSAPSLAGAVRPGGTLIVSGLQAHERDEVCRAFAGLTVVWDREELGRRRGPACSRPRRRRSACGC